MTDPNVPKRIDVHACALADGPFLLRGFWDWYFPSADEPRISQRLKDRLSARLVSRHPWNYEAGDVHDLSCRLPSVGGTRLECEVSLNSWSVSLGTEGGPELGYWDEARPRPFALRWDEVSALIDHASTENSCSSVVALLLSPFVCSTPGDVTEAMQRKHVVAMALARLGVDAPSFVERAMPEKSEADYRWAFDHKRGLVVVGDSCSSRRNAADESFPFDVVRNVRSTLKLPDRPSGLADYQPPPPPKAIKATPLVPLHELVGSRVSHKKFGEGVVRSVSGGGEKAAVLFKSGDNRTLLMRFLRPIDR